MRKEMILILCISLLFCMTGCSSGKLKAEDVTKELNSIIDSCVEQNDDGPCYMNWRLQEHLKTYSEYKLLHASQKEFTTKPKEANDLFTYGASRDALCDYEYALIYHEGSDSYYSIQMNCEDGKITPIFGNAKEL